MTIEQDVQTIGQLSIVPVILETICKTTGMGFAAVARVTNDQWVAGAVRDEIKFGLIPGGELQVNTTICHEIRQSGQPVVIDHVAQDQFYMNHHTPAMYGFQSYISVPIIRNDGEFFGTLCAIDPGAAILNTPEVIGMFRAYADLISFHMNAAEHLPATEVQDLEQHTLTELKTQFASLQKQISDLSGGREVTFKILLDKQNRHFLASIGDTVNHLKGLLEHLHTL